VGGSWRCDEVLEVLEVGEGAGVGGVNEGLERVGRVDDLTAVVVAGLAGDGREEEAGGGGGVVGRAGGIRCGGGWAQRAGGVRGQRAVLENGRNSGWCVCGCVCR